jgi:hypothetical protein
MQGFERPDAGLWDVSALVGHLLPDSGMFAFLAAHRGEVFPDGDWADLFADWGRPSEPATRMAAVMTLQALHGFADRETAEAVRFDLRWKLACGLPLDDPGIHRPRWWCGGGGWRARPGRTGSMRRCGGSSRRPGS